MNQFGIRRFEFPTRGRASAAPGRPACLGPPEPLKVRAWASS
jgi:hypothetical protein